MVSFGPKNYQDAIQQKKDPLNIESIRKICGGDINKLPLIWVHMIWNGKANMDANKRIHMNYPSFKYLKTYMPVKFVRPIFSTITEWAFDLQPHDLQGGVEDKMSYHDDAFGIREELGLDGDSAEPKSIVNEYNDLKKTYINTMVNMPLTKYSKDELFDLYTRIKNLNA